MKKVAIILSGCGVYDGAEIHESVLAMLALAKNGLDYSIFAPDKLQAHVINHLTGEVIPESRNVLIESARIARGDISALTELDPEDYDALLMPGGFGVAKNLSSFAFEGADMEVDPQVAAIVKAFAESKKVIGALCIAPTVIAKVLSKVEVTIGEDEETANAIETMGAKHIPADYTEVVVDKNYKVVTGPCYMLDSTILQVAENAENVVKAMIELM
ncbi:isoprenoid biosynthesis glyoxalase ElbB [Saccharicrinis sp. FJH62]|uniref:isoprenoid biosynthesis glyoxalase ElbB n=1 Tax=Saccharicrinis sp. FJH62 TaxID=3344657 RepID=UPI0035D4B4B7